MSQTKKILMVSMPSLHFFRWTEQLKDSGFEVYWFDVTGSNQYSERMHWVHQNTQWKFKWNFPGRQFMKKSFPKLYKKIQTLNENDLASAFEKYVQKVQPDVVHSFALYVSCSPILKIMNKNKSMPWVYSSWGSDLYYFQNLPNYLKDIKAVLPRVNYLFADCNRDVKIAKQYGFKGDVLDVIPGGGGFNLETLKPFIQNVNDRKVILIKGYQGRSGRAINVLKAVESLKLELEPYQVVVFGANQVLEAYVKQSTLLNWMNFSCHGKLSHNEVLKLMGQALVYIGNSNSDGMPNTLLEAICLGAFPIQSNPGKASEDVIEHGVNGCLIDDCESVSEIEAHMRSVLNNLPRIEKAFEINQSISTKFDFEVVKQIVLSKYLSLG